MWFVVHGMPCSVFDPLNILWCCVCVVGERMSVCGLWISLSGIVVRLQCVLHILWMELCEAWLTHCVELDVVFVLWFILTCVCLIVRIVWEHPLLCAIVCVLLKV